MVYAANPVEINKTNFPDDTFRNIISSTYDYNHNGFIEVDEVMITRNIVCEKQGVSSVKGIEFFTEMQGLWVMDNNISELDVSKNTNLHGIWCSNNPIKHIDLSNNPELEWIYCYECELEELDVSHNPNMAFIECNTNEKLTSLDVTCCPKLEHLTCGSCDLRSIDLSNCPNLSHLDIFRNPKLTSLDVSHCPKMKRLDIWDNPNLSNVDISKNAQLQYYNCANNNVEKIDLSHNPELTKLNCAYNEKLVSLDLSHNTKLSCLYCNSCSLKALDLSHNPRLYYLQAAMNNFSALDIGYNPFLVRTYVEAKRVENRQGSWLGYEWTIDFGGDTSTGGDNVFYLWLDSNVIVDAASKIDVHDVIPYDYCEDVTDYSNLMTREEFMQILYEMAGKPNVNGLSTGFKDVEPGAYYEDAVKWGENNAIAVGYPHLSFNTFGVGKWIRREDVVFMLMRYSEVMGLKRAIDFGRSDDYIDYFDIDYEHWEAVCWSSTWLIMDGKGGITKDQQRIDPLGRATRSDIQIMLDNLYEKNDISGRYKIPAAGPTPPKQADPVEVRKFVNRLYLTIHGREGEEEGLEFWTKHLVNHTMTASEVVRDFVLSPEFIGRNYTNKEFLDKMYLVFFDRKADPQGFDFWVDNMHAGCSKEYVVACFVDSKEFAEICGEYGITRGKLNQNEGQPTGPTSYPPLKMKSDNVNNEQLSAYVEKLYTAILDRPSEPEGCEYWKKVIKEGNGADAGTAAGYFFKSEEYIGKNKSEEEFLVDVYDMFFGRDPRETGDQEGYDYWLKELKEGNISRTMLVEYGFGQSAEFKDILRSYGFEIIE